MGGGGMDTEIRVSTEYQPWDIVFLQKALLKWRLPELCLVLSDETETAETGNLTQTIAEMSCCHGTRSSFRVLSCLGAKRLTTGPPRPVTWQARSLQVLKGQVRLRSPASVRDSINLARWQDLRISMAGMHDTDGLICCMLMVVFQEHQGPLSQTQPQRAGSAARISLPSGEFASGCLAGLLTDVITCWRLSWPGFDPMSLFLLHQCCRRVSLQQQVCDYQCHGMRPYVSVLATKCPVLLEYHQSTKEQYY